MKLACQAAFLLAVNTLIAVPVVAFENLDFEETLLDIESLAGDGEVHNDPNVFEPAIVTPGWSYRAEFFDHTVVGDYSVHGSMIDGHIGVSSQVLLSVNGRESFGGVQTSLQGRHSLGLGGDISGGALESPIPVAVQTGVVPIETRSLRLQVPGWRLPSAPVAESFSVRLNGYEVEMRPIEAIPSKEAPAPGYPDGWEILNLLAESQGLPLPYPPITTVASVVYAGNIEPVAGLVRELAIRPEPVFNVDFQGFETAGMTFDNVQFSPLPAPGPPVQVPEPATLWLLATFVLVGASRRNR